MPRKYELIVRWLSFAVGPWAFLLLAVLLWWVSFYFVAPILFPFSAYTNTHGQLTIFSLERLGWPINFAYSMFVAAIATWLGRSLTLPKAVAWYLATLIGMSVAVHAAMNTLGYRYWYDTP